MSSTGDPQAAPAPPGEGNAARWVPPPPVRRPRESSGRLASPPGGSSGGGAGVLASPFPAPPLGRPATQPPFADPAAQQRGASPSEHPVLPSEDRPLYPDPGGQYRVVIDEYDVDLHEPPRIERPRRLGGIRVVEAFRGPRLQSRTGWWRRTRSLVFLAVVTLFVALIIAGVLAGAIGGISYGLSHAINNK